MKKREAAEPEPFLRRVEPWCVGACSRFLKPGSGKDQVWLLRNRDGVASALLLYSRRTLFPVFGGRTDIPLSCFIRRHFRGVRFHAVQGCRNEALAVEAALAEMGFSAVDIIDYDLMTLDAEPAAGGFRCGPPGLILRRPDVMDAGALFELQAAYEKEEIIPKGGVFNPAACRLNLQRILKEELILSAEMEGRPVGKINTSARSFTRCQIGGVYVHPDYRGLGIARRMTAEFIRPLISGGWGITLFVKKKNAAARAVYQNLGFRLLGDYRISYY
ncbi:MAG: GNAT family N-acetyltransferase [Treponema sp.]|jgi:GNAT superfamily N-acetyltransferase|nr:GNAT family N-acetyltransferase [Treponema sp.]